MGSLIVIFDLEPPVLEARPLSLVQYLLMVHVFHSGSDILGTCWKRSIQVFVRLFDETQTIQQRRRHSPHGCMITRSTEVQQPKSKDVDLVLGWRDNSVDRGFDEACLLSVSPAPS